LIMPKIRMVKLIVAKPTMIKTNHE